MLSETQVKGRKKGGYGKITYEPNLRHPNPQSLSVMERPGGEKAQCTVAIVTGNTELGLL